LKYSRYSTLFQNFRCLLPGEDPSSTADFYPKENPEYEKWLKNQAPWSECVRPKGFTLNTTTVSRDWLEKSATESCADGMKWDTMNEIKTTTVEKVQMVT